MTPENMLIFKFIIEGIAFLTMSIGGCIIFTMLSIGLYKMMKGN
jgi:hypothetical protein